MQAEYAYVCVCTCSTRNMEETQQPTTEERDKRAKRRVSLFLTGCVFLAPDEPDANTHSCIDNHQDPAHNSGRQCVYVCVCVCIYACG